MKAKYFIALFVSALFLTSCASAPVEDSNFSVTPNSPTVVRSVEDLPPNSTTPAEIRQTGVIRITAESAKGQDQYQALTAARIMSQKNLLSIIDGIKLNSDGLVKDGKMTHDEVRAIVNGHIKAFDCGAFYDSSNGIGYYCMEFPVGKPKKVVVK